MRYQTIRTLPDEEKGGWIVPELFQVSLWSSFLPFWVRETYYLVCKAASLRLNKEDQDKLIFHESYVTRWDHVFEKRALCRLYEHLGDKVFGLERSNCIDILKELKLIFEDEDGLYDVYLHPPFPETILNLNLWFRHQMNILRYYKIYLPKLIDIGKNTRFDKKIQFHRNDLLLILSIPTDKTLDYVLSKARKSSVIDYDPLDNDRILITFQKQQLRIAQMQDIELRLIKHLPDPIVEVSFRTLASRKEFGDADAIKDALLLLQEKEMVVTDFPIADFGDEDIFFLEVVV